MKFGSWVAAGALLASCASAMAMQPVQNKEGLSVGAGLGYSFGSFAGNFAAAADVEYGLSFAPIASAGKMAITADDLSDFGSGFKQHSTTLGVLVPVSQSTGMSFGAEAGIARAYTYLRGIGNLTSTGGFAGVRGSFAGRP